MSESERKHASVGLALLSRKMPRVLGQDLRRLAEAAGLHLFALDAHAPLETQGQRSRGTSHGHDGSREWVTGYEQAEARPSHGRPFDIILHKLHDDPVWEGHLSRYLTRHPHVRALDPPAAVHATEDRATMLAAFPPGGMELTLPPPAPQPSLSPLPPGVSPPAAARPKPARLGPEPTAVAAGPPALLGNEGDCESAPSVPLGSDPLSRGCWALLPSPACGRHEAAAAAAGGDPWVAPAAAAAAAAAAATAAAQAAPPLLVRVLAPAQALVRSREELRALAAAGGRGNADAPPLQPPLLLKTQRTDAAGGGGHRLSVALSWGELEAAAEALQRAAAAAVAADTAAAGAPSPGAPSPGAPSPGAEGAWVPLVVQQYVPHTERLYKVYVLGRRVHVTRRASLTLDHLRAMREGPQQQQPGHAPSPPPSQQQQQRQQQGQGQVGEPGRQLPTGRGSGAGTEPAEHRTGDDAPDAAGAADDDDGDNDPSRAVPGAATGGGGAALPTLHHLSATQQSSQNPAAASAGGTAASGGGGAPAAAAAAAPHPPPPPPADVERVLHAVAGALTARLGLTLFNFDVVVPLAAAEGGQSAAECRTSTADGSAGAQARVRELYVVDVNYFPGYDKLPGWEAALVEHLRAVADEVAASAVGEGGGGGDGGGGGGGADQ